MNSTLPLDHFNKMHKMKNNERKMLPSYNLYLVVLEITFFFSFVLTRNRFDQIPVVQWKKKYSFK